MSASVRRAAGIVMAAALWALGALSLSGTGLARGHGVQTVVVSLLWFKAVTVLYAWWAE